MKAGIGCWRWHKAISGAVLGVFAFGVAASAAPAPKDPPKKKSLSSEGANFKPVRIDDDATKARGGGAAGGNSEATIFLQDNDSGFGWFMKSDDVFGYGTWATEMIFANGFSPGDQISSYHMRFYHSTFDDPAGLGGNDAHVSTELWDGDPFSIMDTGCTVGGISAPIAGTAASFTGIGYGVVADLTVTLPAKVTIDCDRVWGAMTFDQGCRGAWRLAGTPGVSAFTQPATVGSQNAAWLLWACEQFGACNTPNGYNSGNCCNDPGTVCDHSDGGLDCDPFGTAPGGQATFCGDGAADYFLADYHDPGVFEGYVSTVSAATDTVVGIVNVSVDAPPGGILPGTDTVVLTEGNHNVWQEFRVGDWDPADSGVKLAAWQLTFESGSYSTGDQGTLTAYIGNGCAGAGDNGPCEADLGPGASCDPPGYFYPAGSCSFAFINQGRDDFVYKTATIPIVTVDVSQPNVRPAGTVIAGPPNDPPCGEPGCLPAFPAEGLYAGTLTTHVPSDAKGCFTMSVKAFPDSQLVDGASQFIPLLGTFSADICVEQGQCCFNLQDLPTGGEGCLDVLQTAETCAQMPGVTLFTPGGSCDDGCACDPGVPASFDDGDACTDDACVDGIAEHTPTDCSDGLTCTVDGCDSGSGCFWTALDCDDGLGCTVDSCTEPNGCNNVAIDPNDGDDCTVDSCNEPDGIVKNIDINQNTFACPSGDPVQDCPAGSTGCVGGFCVCILCFNNAGCDAVDDCLGAPCVEGTCVGGALDGAGCLACRSDIFFGYPGGSCAAGGEKVLVNVMVGARLQDVAGAQWVADYDPSCFEFNSVSGVAPLDFELLEDVDTTAGRIVFASGVNPFGGGAGIAPGDAPVPVAQISFTKLSKCDCCSIDFGGSNPQNTYFTNGVGQPICADPISGGDVCGKDALSWDGNGPASDKVNADCNEPTADVSWTAPTASSSCGGDVVVTCSGTYSDGSPASSSVAHNGGTLPQGTNSFCCSASPGGGSTACPAQAGLDDWCWTVTVNDTQTIDVTVQLSPSIAGDVLRCIKFELFEDCVTDPTVIEENLFFGGIWDFTGHFTDTIKAPKGQYACITARDQLHTLRGCALLGDGACADGVYTAVFKGDPFFGGNWLQGGNLDGWKKDNPTASHDVIDILDFGHFVAQAFAILPIDTPCPSSQWAPHADINGDGIVDELDFAFISNNFLLSSKECCCGAGAAGVPAPLTSISVRELREAGLADLAVADLDKNGTVDTDDIEAYLAGARPDKVNPDRGPKGTGGVRK